MFSMSLWNNSLEMRLSAFCVIEDMQPRRQQIVFFCPLLVALKLICGQAHVTNKSEYDKLYRKHKNVTYYYGASRAPSGLL